MVTPPSVEQVDCVAAVPPNPVITGDVYLTLAADNALVKLSRVTIHLWPEPTPAIVGHLIEVCPEDNTSHVTGPYLLPVGP
jgi:hypothetical protein